MQCVIANPSKTLYIKLDQGQPVTCSKANKQIFDRKKACNILASLPRKLHKFNFQIQDVIATNQDNINEVGDGNQNVICNKNYVVPEGIQKWLKLLGGYDNIPKQLATRQEELNHMLSDVDKEISNCLHKIELSSRMNACQGYMQYRHIYEVLEKRRAIKDEICVIRSIMGMKITDLANGNLDKVVNGLANRKFTLRLVEDGVQEEI